MAMHSQSPLRTLRPATATFILGIALLSLSLSASSKDFYKWQDNKGGTHYSAHPPKDRPSVKVQASNIKGTPAPASKVAATKAKPNQGDAAPAREKSPERCQQAKQNLKTLQEHPRVRIKKEDGEYRYLTPTEHTQKLKDAQKIIQEKC